MILGTNTLVISKAGTTTVLDASTNQSVYGRPVVLTATVTPQIQGTPTGTVTFKAGLAVRGTAGLNGSPPKASLVASSLPVAGSPHTVTAEYNGDTNFGPSMSAPIEQPVLQANTAVAPVTSSVNPARPTDSITFSAKISALHSSATPTGAVQFKCSGTNLGSPVVLVNG